MGPQSSTETVPAQSLKWNALQKAGWTPGFHSHRFGDLIDASDTRASSAKQPFPLLQQVVGRAAPLLARQMTARRRSEVVCQPQSKATLPFRAQGWLRLGRISFGYDTGPLLGPAAGHDSEIWAFDARFHSLGLPTVSRSP
jgi:hypothetical protein